MNRTTFHIVGGASRSRAEQARVAFALGHHAEVYSDIRELLERPPGEGVAIVADEPDGPSARELAERFAEDGIWLPLVMAAPAPEVGQVVAAIKGGALGYLTLPLEIASFAAQMEGILRDADEHTRRRRREIEARRAIARLSPRERQVLEMLSAGCSNKEIGRLLAISPRTVEIHRGNMMTKIGADHPAHAVRLWVDGQTDAAPQRARRAATGEGEHEGVAGRIGARDDQAEPAAPSRLRQRQ